MDAETVHSLIWFCIVFIGPLVLLELALGDEDTADEPLTADEREYLMVMMADERVI